LLSRTFAVVPGNKNVAEVSFLAAKMLWNFAVTQKHQIKKIMLDNGVKMYIHAVAD